MKSKILLPSLLATASLCLLTFTACTKTKTESLTDGAKAAYVDTKALVKDAAISTKNVVVQGWDDLKGYTFEKRSDFTLMLKSKQADLEASVSKLQAEHSDAQASASRKAAMAELKDSQSNYKEKLAALGNASADTWNSARDNVVAAWDRLEASYAKARADK